MPLVAVFGALLALSACSSPSAVGVLSSPSAAGVLTQADIPSYLDLVANPAATATATHVEGTEPHCKKGGVAIFTLPGRTLPKAGSILSMNTSSGGPLVVSADDSCPTPSDAHMAFNSDYGGAGRAIAGIGDEAGLVDLSPRQRSYAVEWREGNQLGVIQVVGPTKDKRITPALAELLARRAAARS